MFPHDPIFRISTTARFGDLRCSVVMDRNISPRVCASVGTRRAPAVEASAGALLFVPVVPGVERKDPRLAGTTLPYQNGSSVALAFRGLATFDAAAPSVPPRFLRVTLSMLRVWSATASATNSTKFFFTPSLSS